MVMEEYSEILGKTALFEGLSGQDRQALLQHAKQRSYPAGGTIIQEGETGHLVYVVVAGAVQVVTVTASGQEIEIIRLEPGDYFGEQALLPESVGRRNATVRAFSDATVLGIAKQDFLRVLANNESLREHLLRMGKAQKARRRAQQ
jgi:CRP-like cAMP-binding protein